MKNKYEVVIGNIGTMPYASLKLAKECYDTYVTLSKSNTGRAAGESVTLFKNGEILKEYHGRINKISAMFNFEKIKQMIEKCPTDEIVILAGNWSINKPKYDNAEDENEDFEEFEKQVGYSVYVSDYNDLIVDVHGIMNN